MPEGGPSFGSGPSGIISALLRAAVGKNGLKRDRGRETMAAGTALISGVTGVVGARIARHLAGLGDWRAIGVSRRAPMGENRIAGIEYLALDLQDRAACAKAIGEVSGITHFFNAARFEHVTTQPEPIDINTGMFVNLLDALEQGGHPLQHVHLVQGTKYYGSTAG